jgi:micrococcal nuclease
MYIYKAYIKSIFDGDTITAVIDLGCHIKVEKQIRLYGINTPELRGDTKLAGLEARDFLSSQILNKDVYIQTFKDKTEKYGRLLAKIYIEGGTYINELMVSSGHAVPYME